MTLNGERILIVGGASGIGFAVAQAARAEGADIVLASTQQHKLDLAAERLGGVETRLLDITDEGSVEGFFAASGPFAHIVTTAGDWGKGRRAPLAEIDLRDAEALLRVRFWGAMILAKHGAARVPAGGSITLTSGMSAFRPQKGSVMATAMAGAVAHLTYGLAVELAPIRVNAVLPGGVATEIWHGLPEAMRQTESARFANQLLPRIAEADEVAQAYLYLMKGGYTTGQLLRVDGGSELC
jgi:NAD(P)-dependent dehydrogenase (short-subunit alcohol dehydrogenase family)